eukprot:scaffold114084_cov63-Phaeocystis_antarctica.AAC.1
MARQPGSSPPWWHAGGHAALTISSARWHGWHWRDDDAVPGEGHGLHRWHVAVLLDPRPPARLSGHEEVRRRLGALPQRGLRPPGLPDLAPPPHAAAGAAPHQPLRGGLPHAGVHLGAQGHQPDVAAAAHVPRDGGVQLRRAHVGDRRAAGEVHRHLARRRDDALRLDRGRVRRGRAALGRQGLHARPLAHPLQGQAGGALLDAQLLQPRPRRPRGTRARLRADLARRLPRLPDRAEQGPRARPRPAA